MTQERDELPVPRWRVRADGVSDCAVINGTLYQAGAIRASWDLPTNLRDFEPVNWTAKLLARYVNTHTDARPTSPADSATPVSDGDNPV